MFPKMCTNENKKKERIILGILVKSGYFIALRSVILEALTFIWSCDQGCSKGTSGGSS